MSAPADRRAVRVPAPSGLRHLEATGPVEPRAARDAAAAESRLDLALRLAASDEAMQADELGWACWWGSPRFRSGASIRASVWVLDDTSGVRSLDALEARLVAASFLVRRSARPSSPEAVLRGHSPLHARVRGALMGHVAGDVPVFFEVSAAQGVEVEPRWRWRAQPCPWCGHFGHPVECIAGFPDGEVKLAVGLGEAVLAGCLVDDAEDHPAQCAGCGRGFRPRR